MRRPSRPDTALRPPTPLEAGWIALLLGAIALAAWAAIDDHLPADVVVGRWIQRHDPFSQGAIDLFRDIGSTIAAAATIALVAVALLISGRRRLAVAAAAFLLGLALQSLLKDLVDRPRTSILFLDQRAGFDSESFPSGHVMSSVIAGALVATLALRVSLPPSLPAPWLWRLPLLAWGLLLPLIELWTSVASGVHWPSDALGGAAWGVIAVIPGVWGLETARRHEVRAHRRFR